MSETNTRDALLTTAIQDLRAASALLVERLPPIIRHVEDGDLRRLLDKAVEKASSDCTRLVESGRGEGGEPNLWMKGVLDDADRDASTIAAGPLRDTALIGAIRKGKAAAIVSYETAIALAEDDDLTAVLKNLRESDIADDHALRQWLEAITAAVG
jgi:ferritin-like metal-binding protein YciE